MSPRKPVLVHGWMSVREMVEAAGLRWEDRVKQHHDSTGRTRPMYGVRSRSGERLFEGSPEQIQSWLRKEGYVR